MIKNFIVAFMFFSVFCTAQDNKGTIRVEKEAVYEIVDQMPSFPGGTGALNQYISQNVIYPQTEIEKRIEGIVLISFVVEKDGRLNGFDIKKGAKDGIALDQEALRAVMAMPNWIPGRKNGEAVAVRFNLPVKFNLR